METKKLLIDFATMFVLILVVTVVVTFLYSLVVHGVGIIDWETAFRFAIILGIVLSWIKAKK
ncbi:MAG: hypothetical protein WBF08_11045 [Candidatus Bathyarchaeia archaeon]